MADQTSPGARVWPCRPARRRVGEPLPGRRFRQVAAIMLTRWIANPSLAEEKSGFWGDYRGTS